MATKKGYQDQYRFQAAVEYVAGYFNVKSVVIADNEGMVVACAGREKFDAEVFSARAVEMMKTIDLQIGNIIDPASEYAVIKTPQNLLTVARVAPFILIVVAKRQIDDLLHIRISRALEMISSHYKNKYPALMQSDKPRDKKSPKNMEEIHV